MTDQNVGGPQNGARSRLRQAVNYLETTANVVQQFEHTERYELMTQIGLALVAAEKALSILQEGTDQ